MDSILSTKLEHGTWFHMTMYQRRSVRHHWAELIEIGDIGFDNCPHPYTNWGYANRLDWLLRKDRAA